MLGVRGGPKTKESGWRQTTRREEKVLVWGILVWKWVECRFWKMSEAPKKMVNVPRDNRESSPSIVDDRGSFAQVVGWDLAIWGVVVDLPLLFCPVYTLSHTGSLTRLSWRSVRV